MKDGSIESARSEPTVFGATRRYIVMVVAFALVGLVAAIGYTLHKGNTYVGKTNITTPASQGGQSPDVDSEVLLLESPAVAQRAATIANAALRGKILSTQDFYNGNGSLTIFPPVGAAAGAYGATIIGVTFSASSPRVAQVGANSLLRAFDQERSAAIAAQYNQVIRGIDHTILTTTTPDQRSALEAQRDQELVNEQLDLSQQPTVAWAIEPAAPAGGGFKKTSAEGLVVGLILGVAVAYVRASRRRVYVDRRDPAALYGVPIIGEIPAFETKRALRSGDSAEHRLPISYAPHSAAAEAFRFAAGSIERIRTERGPRLSLVFIAPLADSDKSKVVANLALTIAQGGTRVLAVDADAGLASQLLLGTTADGKGLEQVLTEHQPLASCTEASPLNDAVTVLRPGPAVPRRVTGATRAKAMAALLTTAKSSYDVVLIDSPGLLQVADTSDLVDASDAAIIVLGPHGLIQDHAETADRLKLMGADVIGYIYHGAPVPAPLARYQRNGSPARPRDPKAPADLDPSTGDFPTLAFRQPLDDGNGSLSKTSRG
jgi:Mrp family chromosome partitioning ATPase